jgi:hypothetical protein
MRFRDPRLNRAALLAFQQAVQDSRPVTGLTHLFYRYPARFSPTFARAAIELFTEPGDLVLDPFMGGGTSLVEALVLGRPAIGADISTLAQFIARVKVTPLAEADIRAVTRWTDDVIPFLSIHAPLYVTTWPDHLGGKKSWRVGKLIGQALAAVTDLSSERARRFARCLLLRTGQWALDGRSRIPDSEEFRAELRLNLARMVVGIREFAEAIAKAETKYGRAGRARARCIVSPAEHLHRHSIWRQQPSPRLIVTSPPYPGVHVVYARWQVMGRRETPTPFWIANSLDGSGQAYYTFGDRHSERSYFNNARAALEGISKIAGPDTIVVQLIGFARPERQLPAYLKVMQDCGFEEVDLGLPERLWRQVPNRKWHADQLGETAGSQEVVLIHRLAPNL